MERGRLTVAALFVFSDHEIVRLARKDFAKICAGSETVVLPTPLLASVARQQLAHENRALGLESWERPNILSLNAWLVSCWNAVRFRGAGAPALLSLSQEVELWRQLFEEVHPNVFDPAGAARLAVRAGATMAEWHLPLDSEWWERSKDSESYRQLYRRFARELNDRGCISRADIWRLLPDWIRSGAYEPGIVSFVGFPQLSPALSQVITSVGINGRSVTFDAKKAKPRVISEAHSAFADEVETAARWARKQLEEAPGRSIGIFVANLQENHQVISRVFESILDPPGSVQLHSPVGVNEDEQPSLFHLHLSKPLIREPLVTSALTMLELLRSRIRITDASAILLSPFLPGAAEERSDRALADLNLRRSRDIDVTFSQIEYRTANCERLVPIWREIRSVRPKDPVLDFDEWGELFGDLVNASGWPGDEALTKREASVAQAWNDALSELGALGFISPPVPFEIALSRLRDALLQTRSPEGGDQLSPIQILDLEQANGLQFDFSAVLGLSEENWPRTGRLVPFIPPAIQRAGDSSLSFAQRCEDESHDKAAALFSTAPSMLVTYSGELAPQVRGFVKAKSSSVSKWTGLTMNSSDIMRREVELVEDFQAPPFRCTEPLSGGVGVIKSQAQCPFRAFAEYRLHAHRPEDACFGFDARERGGYLHRALENVWKRLGSSDQLRSATEAELENLVNDAVTEALASDRNSPFRDVISAAERNRLREAIRYWLIEKERSRGTSFRVEHVEEKKTVQIGGLQLRLRVDRIDRLEDGSVVLIDYKSGDISEKSLLGERPSEPQLLVYAAAMEEEVDGVFLAQVRPREAKTAGSALHSHFPPARNSKFDWATLRDASRISLRELADEFVAGHAPVDPLRGACTYCSLPALCRIGEGARASKEDEDD